MSTAPPSYQPVATQDERTRSDFVIRVYQHLALAIVAFVGIEAFFFTTGIARSLYEIIAGSPSAWLLVLGGFMTCSTRPSSMPGCSPWPWPRP
jgi:FtsH-binding integral membrane protein